MGSTTGRRGPRPRGVPGGRRAATGRVLGLHHDTVAAARSRRVRERLGVPLDGPGNRLALQTACRALTSP
ncbi:helix-turn-helix domain-containing protein [Streptomyces sp. NPDC048224]|uniref:helix-turn-helix domain-containing protein n=1 Tax=unclassified Streptomyces TaxID=2593676 RepID=UPI0033E23AC3